MTQLRKPWRVFSAALIGSGFIVMAMLLRLEGFSGGQGWSWPYRSIASLRAEGVLSRLWIPLLIGPVFFVVLKKTVMDLEPAVLRRHTAKILIAFLIVALAMQFAFASLNPLGVAQIPYAVFDRYITSYFTESLKIESLSSFLANYSNLMPSLLVHARTHPPGPILLFYAINHFFERFPSATACVAFVLRKTPVNISAISEHTGLKAAQAAGLVFSSFLIPSLGCLTALPLFFLGKLLYCDRVGFEAAAFWGLVPSMALFTPELDQVYALLSTTAVLLVCMALKSRRLFPAALGGLLSACGLFMSISFLVIVGLNTILFALWCIVDTGAGAKLSAKLIAAYLFSLTILILSVSQIIRFSVTGTFRMILASQSDARLAPQYFPWVFYNIYDFFLIGLGVPFSIAFGYFLVCDRRTLITQKQNLLATVFLFMLLCLDASGIILSEVSRVWMYLLFVPVLYASRAIDTFVEAGKKQQALLLVIMQYTIVVFYKLQLTTIVVPELFR